MGEFFNSWALWQKLTFVSPDTAALLRETALTDLGLSSS